MKTLLSLNLKDLANNKFEKNLLTFNVPMSCDKVHKSIDFNAVCKVNDEFNNDKLRISTYNAVKELISNGASPFYNDSSGNILLTDLIKSETLDNKTKYFIIESIKDEDWKNLSKKHMNLIFESVAENDLKETELNDFINWKMVVDKLLEKGLTFYQGNNLNALELCWLRGSLQLMFGDDTKEKAKYDFIIKYVPDFDFNKKYQINEKENASILEIIESYIKKENKVSILFYLRSYILQSNLDKKLISENKMSNKKSKI